MAGVVRGGLHLAGIELRIEVIVVCVVLLTNGVSQHLSRPTSSSYRHIAIVSYNSTAATPPSSVSVSARECTPNAEERHLQRLAVRFGDVEQLMGTVLDARDHLCEHGHSHGHSHGHGHGHGHGVVTWWALGGQQQEER